MSWFMILPFIMGVAVGAIPFLVLKGSAMSRSTSK
jgi:hypothetical protein